ncbi:MAG TPA: DMT family transporter [Roseiflexaceae bacterium]|nr:DMT family transporter [Roseiflexaceae bacterium]
MPPRTLAIIALLLVMAIWGSAFTVTKATIDEIPPVMIALLRFVLGSAILLPVLIIRRKQAMPLLKRSWLTMAAMGICGFTFFQAGANVALAYSTATEAAIIQSVIPVMTAILAALVLREQPSIRRILGILLSLAGVVVVILVAAPSEHASDPLFGGAIMLGVVALWAVYTVLAKRLSQADPLLVTAYSTIFGALFLVPLALLESGGAGMPTISTQGWLSILYLGLLSSTTANLLYNWSLTHLEASQVATFINLVPIVGVAIAVLFLGEPLLGWQLVGGAVTLLGVWLAT